MDISRLKHLAGVPLLEIEEEPSSSPLDTTFAVGRGKICIIRENSNKDVEQMAKMLNVPSGWVLTKVSDTLWAAYEEGSVLVLYESKDDFDKDFSEFTKPDQEEE